MTDFEEQLKELDEIERIRTIVKMVLAEERQKSINYYAQRLAEAGREGFQHIEINIQPIEMRHDVGEELDALYKDAEEALNRIY